MTTASPPVLNRLITLVSTRASGFFVPVEYLYSAFMTSAGTLLGDYTNGVWNCFAAWRLTWITAILIPGLFRTSWSLPGSRSRLSGLATVGASP